MTTLIANEFRKLRTIRGPWLLLAAGPVLVIVGVAGEVAGGADLSNSDLWRTLAGGVACHAAFAAIGVPLGALIRNLAAAIATALAWIALVEGLIGELISDLEPWLPFAGGQALGRLPGAPDISQWAGGLLLAAYAVVFAAIALTTSVRRDIT
jgi:ABC-2 type transport system permease protein